MVGLMGWRWRDKRMSGRGRDEGIVSVVRIGEMAIVVVSVLHQ